MAGRTEHEAVQSFIDPLQLALSCATRAVINVSGGYSRDKVHMLVLNRGEAVRLQGGAGIWLSIAQHYRVVEHEGPRGPWKVSTVGYLYALQDSAQQEIVAYHWHPTSHSRVTYPHAHLGSAASIGRADLARAHLPTGRIAIEEVLRLAIEGFSVRPSRRTGLIFSSLLKVRTRTGVPGLEGRHLRACTALPTSPLGRGYIGTRLSILKRNDAASLPQAAAEGSSVDGAATGVGLSSGWKAISSAGAASPSLES